MGKKIVDWEDQLGEVPLGGNEPAGGVLVTYDDGSKAWMSDEEFESLDPEIFDEEEDA